MPNKLTVTLFAVLSTALVLSALLIMNADLLPTAIPGFGV